MNSQDDKATQRFHLRRIAQPLLMIAALLTGVTVVAATLSRRPKIDPPETFRKHYSPTDFVQTLATSNSQLAKMAQDQEVQTAPRADDLTIARRISLALVGNGMSLEEIRALMLVPEDRRVEWWTSYLLEDRRWADYFAERFARAYVGTDAGPFLLFRRRKFTMWLADQLENDRPYDQIVRKVLSAEGLWTDTPQVNFITATMDSNGDRPDPIRLAGRTARAFMAQRIDCLQCHDDFLGDLDFGGSGKEIEGVQQHFHQLAAFYSGTSLSDPVFSGIREDGTNYVYKYLGEEEEVTVTPQVPFYAELLPEDGKPRERLAAWVTSTENRAFSRATVNRVWALLFLRPLVAPVDSIPLDDNVPEVLDTLAEDFSKHQFDLKRLIRLIIQTDAFQRSSRADFEITGKHERHWAAFPLTQLRPEQVAQSAFQASKLTAVDYSSSIFTQLKSFGDRNNFLKAFGDRGEDEFEEEAVTITQRLVLMNGNLTKDYTKVDMVNNASTRIANIVNDDLEVVRLVYLNVLNRVPSDTEASAFSAFLENKKNNDRARAVGDIYWALMNSTEFSWNH
ncbi:MAG: DUF1553 domain-containing protein [Planctomycetota bacterium]